MILVHGEDSDKTRLDWNWFWKQKRIRLIRTFDPDWINDDCIMILVHGEDSDKTRLDWNWFWKQKRIRLIRTFDPDWMNDHGTLTIPQYRFNKTKKHSHKNKILGSKRKDRFSNPFLELVPKTLFVCTCFDMVIYVRARGHCESARRSARR